MRGDNRSGNGGIIAWQVGRISVDQWETIGIQLRSRPNEIRYVEIDCFVTPEEIHFDRKIVGSEVPAWFANRNNVVFAGYWIVVKVTEINPNRFRLSLMSSSVIVGSGVDED